MLRAKIIVSSIVFIAILAIGALVNIDVNKQRYQYFMKPPVPNGTYRIYNTFESSGSRQPYTPHRPREYMKIINIEAEH